MKTKIFVLLALLVSSFAFASPGTFDQIYAPTGLTFFMGPSLSPVTFPAVGSSDSVLTAKGAVSLSNKTFDQTSNVGLEQQAVWDWTANGGTAGAFYNLGNILPTKAIITNAFIDVITQPVGSGASIAIQGLADQDLMAATVVGSLPVGQKQLLPVGGTITHAIKGATGIVVHVTGANLTAGRFLIFLDYSISQ